MSMAQLLAELQAEYIKTFPYKVESMTKHWNEKKVDSLEDEFHKIKGTGRSYGLPEVSLLGEAMERICSNSPGSLPELMPLAMQCFNRIFKERTEGQVPDLENWAEFSKIAAERRKL